MRTYAMRINKGRRLPIQIGATVDRVAGADVALLNVRQRGEQDAYLLIELAASDGRGFRIRKPDGTNFEVFIHARQMNRDTCSCAGNTYTGRCKHADAIRGLIVAGELPANQQPERPSYPSLTAEEI